MFNVLFLRHSAGFEHSYLPHAEVTFKELARETGRFRVTTTNRCDRIKQETLDGLDVLVFATTGELPFDDDQKQMILDFVRGGKGFFGIHNAADTCYEWAEYGEMIGGYFNGHPWTQNIVANVEDGDHPATRHLGDSVGVFDEIYIYRNWDRARTRVLMSVENSTVDLEKGKREDNDYALAWCHSYGEGRVMYSAFGHPDDLWSVPWFRRHILGGLLWAAGTDF